MEVYTLDPLLRRTAVIDRFESLIWTERWGAFGDFELVIHSTTETRQLLTVGTQLVTNESDRVMTIDTAENKNDAEGRSTLTVTGRSLERILDDRVCTEGFVGLTEDNEWVITGTPGDICRFIFQKICVEGILSPADIIPFIQEGTIYPIDTIAESGTVLTVRIPISTVYTAIKDLCDIYGMGMRLVRNLDASELYFDIYTGSDRTSQQSTLPPVIFSPHLDNLTNVTELTSNAGYKNVAYVFAKNDSEMVYANGIDPLTTGFERRVLLVDASSITDEAGPTLTSMLINKGLDELSKNRSMFGFDGEIPQAGSYKYRQDYNLGDLVEMRTTDGVTNNMRVTEQIFVSDAEGDRSYPTLALDTLITPGTWISWDYSQVWQSATDHWETA